MNREITQDKGKSKVNIQVATDHTVKGSGKVKVEQKWVPGNIYLALPSPK